VILTVIQVVIVPAAILIVLVVIRAVNLIDLCYINIDRLLC